MSVSLRSRNNDANAKLAKTIAMFRKTTEKEDILKTTIPISARVERMDGKKRYSPQISQNVKIISNTLSMFSAVEALTK